MSSANLTVHRLARWTLEDISEADRTTVLEAVEALRNRSPEEWPADRVTVLDPEEGTYLLRAGPTWRVFLRRAPSGDLDIRDVVHQERLDWLAELRQKEPE